MVETSKKNLAPLRPCKTANIKRENTLRMNNAITRKSIWCNKLIIGTSISQKKREKKI